MSSEPKISSVKLSLGRIVRVETLLHDGSHDLSLHHLDPVLGSSDGRFSLNNENFFRSVRNIRLVDSTLQAEHRNSRGEWIDDEIKLSIILPSQPGDYVRVRLGGDDKDGPLAHKFELPDLRNDWSLVCIGTSALLFRCSSNQPTLPLVYFDLALCLGNDNGYFDQLGNDFLLTARNVRLLGTRLYADLLATDGHWRSRDIDLKGFLDGRVMLGDPQWALFARFATPRPATVEVPQVLPSAKSFHHPLNRELDAMRLCLIMPGDWWQPITCTLFTSDGPFTMPYQCLSYVWGDPTDTLAIWVNQQPYRVTRNLYKAMQQLRRRNDGLPVWIDAICINQHDIEEKSWQISLMSKIYGRADSVMIWLGDDPDKPNNGCEGATRGGSDSNILTLEDTIRRVTASGHLFPGAFSSALDQAAAALHHQRILLSFRALSRAPWWDRIWVVQEAVVARNAIMLFGSSEIGLNNMFQTVKGYYAHMIHCLQCRAFLEKIPPYLLNPLNDWSMKVNSIALIRREHHKHIIDEASNGREISSPPNEDAIRERWSILFECLSICGARAATNPRDKVFGILALIPSYATNPFIPNYNLSVEQIYQDFTHYAIVSTSSLSILDLACWAEESGDDSNPVTPSLPSWVVDWRSGSVLDAGYTPILCSQRFHFNAQLVPLTTRSVINDNLLAIDGAQVDNILAVTKDYWPGAVPEHDRRKNVLEQWIVLAFTTVNSDHYPCGGTVKDAFWRTILYDHFHCGFENERQYRRAEDQDIEACLLWGKAILDYRSDHQGSNPFLNPHTIDGVRSPLNLVEATVTMCATFKKLFITTKGYLGFGPPAMRAGDVLHVLKSGTQWLHVLRPEFTHPHHDEEHPVYSLVGPAYAHGWMDGKALQLLDASRTIYLT